MQKQILRLLFKQTVVLRVSIALLFVVMGAAGYHQLRKISVLTPSPSTQATAGNPQTAAASPQSNGGTGSPSQKSATSTSAPAAAAQGQGSSAKTSSPASSTGGTTATSSTSSTPTQSPVKVTPPSTPAPASTEAAVKYGWGAPLRTENMDNLNNFNLYTAAADWGIKSPNNVSLAGGVMTINGKSDGTTGGMSHSFSQQYGKWETRMQVGGTQGCWRPVLLLWRDSGTSAEIDYSESAGNWNSTRFFLHYGTSSQTTATGAVDATQWVNYAVEWTPTVIRGYINGVQFFEDTNSAHFPNTTMHETFQLDSQTKSGTCNVDSWMKVDWLKVY